MKRPIVFFLLGVVGLGLLGALLAYYFRPSPEQTVSQAIWDRPKLYWFIPDGMRADPEVFNIYRWAEEGRLPNIRRIMKEGTYGFCRPTFPSHTPTNFATLFTGSYPEIHGVNDGPMHTMGNPLDRVSIGGFNSMAKLVEPIWVTLESRAAARVALLSIPGSTPPELEKGITIRGRWGGGVPDFHAVNFHVGDDPSFRRAQGRASRLFFFGPPLTQYVDRQRPGAWKDPPPSFSPPWEATMTAWGATIYAYVYDSTDNANVDYDTVRFSRSRKDTLVTLRGGQWSEWMPISLTWKIPQRDPTTDVETSFRIKLIKLDDDGLLRVRFLYNSLNPHVTDPEYVAEDLIKGVGAMVDFVDNFPPQLIHYPEDKVTFLEEAEFSLDWHHQAVPYVVGRYEPDVFIHDTYTPNQMLTSRWWMGYVDPSSARYDDISEDERRDLWDEVHWLYKKLDDIVGTLIDHADDNTFIVVTSDHGAVPLDQWVRLNNLFAREGLLHFRLDEQSGEPTIDWQRTRAIYLKMDNIYINPNGLAGPWQRASGREYEELRERVKSILLSLEDRNGVKPVAQVIEWERAEASLRLLEERVGDLVVANQPGYGWNEEMTEDLEVFSTPLKTGYKQAILADEVKGMWVPFMIIGPGVKKGHALGSEPIEMVDQYPTIMRLLGLATPDFVQGKVVTEVLQAEDN